MQTRWMRHTNRFDRLWDELTQPIAEMMRDLANDPFFAPRSVETFPAVNIWEDRDDLYCEAEVPGLGMNDIEVLVVGSELTIKGRRPAADESGDVCYHRQERGFGEFTRTVALPIEVEADHVEAGLKDGVLTIRMPKAPHARPKQIPVKLLSKN
jgi:HSP20 family protein